MTKLNHEKILAINKKLKIENQQQLQVLNHSIDSIRIVDKNLKIVWANKIVYKQRIENQPVVGNYCHTLFTGRDKPCPNCPTLKSLLSGDVERSTICETDVKGIKGVTYWEDYAIPLKDEYGQINRIVQLSRDITENEKNKIELFKSEQKYKTVFEQSSDVIILIDPKTQKPLAVNQQIKPLLGYSIDEFKTMQISDYEVCESTQEIQNHIQIVLEKGEDTFETKMETKNGTIKDVLVSVRIIEIQGQKYLHTIFRDITTQKQTETIIKESERKFRGVLETLNLIAVTLDRKGRILFCNDYLLTLSGWNRNQVLNKSWFDIFLPQEIRDDIKESVFIQTIHSGNFPQKFQNEIILKSGNRRLINWTNTVFKDLNGDVESVTSIGEDVTDKIKYEKELKEQTKTLNNILDKAADGICVCHNIRTFPFVKFTHWNPRMMEITGYTMEQINEFGWYQTMYPDPEIQKIAIHRMETMRENDDILAEEWDITASNQEIKTLSISTSILKRVNEETHVLGIMQDVTERKQHVRQIAASQKEWQEIFQAIGQPAMILDRDYNIIKANTQTLMLTGLSSGELIGKKCFEVFHNETTAADLCPMQTLLKNGTLKTVEMESEVLGRTFLVSITPILDTDDQIEKIIHISTDITERKKLEAQIHHTQKMKAIGTMAGGIAHEFNNILSIILGNAEFAMSEVSGLELAADCLNEIRTASLRAKEVVSNLLNVARKTPTQKSSILINKVIVDSLDLLKNTIPSTIKIQTKFLNTSEMVYADPAQITQILMNLCLNSVHAINGNPGIISIQLKIDMLDEAFDAPHFNLSPGTYIKLTVEDTGKGISTEHLDHIFDPYFTTKDVDQGLGMGLAVVQGIVKNHNGAIQVKSDIEKGTKVEILFPLINGDANEFEKQKENIPAGNEKILFVDDEASIVTTNKRLLENYGYEVVGISNSLDALELFRSDPDKFDIIITDMTMPELSGDRLAKKVKTIRNIPVILCTGYSDNLDEKKAVSLGVDRYLMKPVKSLDLVNAIQGVLDKQ